MRDWPARKKKGCVEIELASRSDFEASKGFKRYIDIEIATYKYTHSIYNYINNLYE